VSAGSILTDFKSMPRNVRVNVSVLPLWSIPFNLVNSYASLYMMNQGITASGVGLINSASFVLKTCLALFAGYVVNRFGRRLSVGLLDMIGWSFPMLIYFFAVDYWQFLIAALINCITVINGVASQCFLVEDVAHDQRIKAFNYSGLVGALCTLFVPVSGLLISRFSLVPAIRMLYLFAFCSMFLAAVCKLVFLRETSVGKKMMENNDLSPNPFLNMPRQVKYILGNKKLILLFSMNIILNFALIINNLYYFPFLTRLLHFSESLISLFPFITTAVSLCVYFFVIPNIRNRIRSLLTSVFLYGAGALALIVSSFTAREVAYLCVILWAMAAATMAPVLNSMIANALKDEMRTEVIGFFNMFSMLCMFPAGYFGGWLFDISPRYPIYFIFLVYLTSYLMFLLVSKKRIQPENERSTEV
jgi:MFS family permease